MAPRNQTGSGSIAEDVVFGNFGSDDLDFGDDNLDEGGDDDRDEGDDDGDDDQLDALGSQRDDQDDLDDLTGSRQQRGRQQDDGRPSRRGQFGRQQGDRRQQQQRGRTQDDVNRGVLDDLRVTHTRVHSEAPVEADKAGNLVNKETGKIVARAGREARYYQNASNARRQAAQHQERVRDTESKLSKTIGIATNLDTQLKVLQGHQAAVTQLGIQPQDQLVALRLFKDLKDNPVATIKGILTRAQTRGITMDQLGLGAAGGGGFDAKTLADLVNEKITAALGPIQQRVNLASEQDQRAQQDQQAKDAAMQEVNTFFDTNPEASKYASVFSGLMADPKYAGKSLGELWANIQLTLRDRQPRQQQRFTNGQQRRQTPLRGRMPTSRRAPPNQGNDDGLAPVNQEYGDILNGIMDDIGMSR